MASGAKRARSPSCEAGASAQECLVQGGADAAGGPPRSESLQQGFGPESLQRGFGPECLQERKLHECLRFLFGPTGEPATRDLDFLETFAGDSSISRGLRLQGLVGAAMDLRFDAKHDIMTSVGFLCALKLLARVRPGGLFWSAPPCSSWVFMSRGSTGRHESVAGWHGTSPFVTTQNALAARVASLCSLASARGVWWVVEQPSSSRMFEYCPWVVLAEGLRPNIGMVRTFMDAFGADTAKLLLVGTAPFLGQLKRGLRPSDTQRIKNLDVSLVVRSSAGRISGSKDLKATQSYPLGFGNAVAAAFVHISKGQQGSARASKAQQGPARLSKGEQGSARVSKAQQRPSKAQQGPSKVRQGPNKAQQGPGTAQQGPRSAAVGGPAAAPS